MAKKRREAVDAILGVMNTARRVQRPQSPSKRITSPSLTTRPHTSDSLSAQKERGHCPSPIRDCARSRPFTEESSDGSNVVLAKIQTEMRHVATVCSSEPPIDDENVMRSGCGVVSTAAGTHKFLVHAYVTSDQCFLRCAARAIGDCSVGSATILFITSFQVFLSDLFFTRIAKTPTTDRTVSPDPILLVLVTVEFSTVDSSSSVLFIVGFPHMISPRFTLAEGFKSASAVWASLIGIMGN